jgi:osmotically-inducible protein OsmY
MQVSDFKGNTMSALHSPSVGKSSHFSGRIRMLAAMLLLSGTAVGLSGCFPVVATGVVAGALSISDRRTTGAQTEDAAIELKAFSQFRERFKSDKISLSVVSFNRIVLVTGVVPDAATKAEAARVVSRIDNVRNVLNEITIGAPTSLKTYGSDVVLTTRVKASFIDRKDLQANLVKVYTEAGVVYLMGLVTDREANVAAEIASKVPGVLRVVRAFEIISEAEAARLKAQIGGPGESANPAPIRAAAGPAVDAPPAAKADEGAVVTPVR